MSDSDDDIQCLGSNPPASFLNAKSKSKKKERSNHNSNSNSNIESQPSQRGAASITSGLGGIGLAGIDRAQMERDRLRRMENRDPNSILTSATPTTTTTSNSNSNSHHAKRQRNGINTMSNLKSDSEESADEQEERGGNNSSNNQVPPPRVATPSGELLRPRPKPKSAWESNGNALGTSSAGSGSGSVTSTNGRDRAIQRNNLNREVRPLPAGPVSRPRGGTGPHGVSLEALRRIDPMERFFQGAIKYSENRHAGKGLKGVPFSDFLLPATPSNSSGLKHALLSTYCADLDWLFSLMPENVPTTLVARNNGIDKTWASSGTPKNWNLHIPQAEQLRTEFNYQKTMHIKMILLSFETHLRVVVLTGNLVTYDWDIIENSALVFDAPRVKDGNTSPPSDLSRQLLLTLRNLDLPNNHPMMQELRTGAFDMSAAPFKLVLSAPTTPLTDWESIYTLGLGRLLKIVRDYGMGEVSPGVLEAQGSSLGKYSQNWLKNFIAIASGAPNNRLPNLANGTPWNVYPIRVLFPSQSWVVNKLVREGGGGGTFFGKKYDDAAINSLLRQPVSKRGNVMMHAKSLLFLKRDIQLKELQSNVPPTRSWSSGGQTLGGSSSSSSASSSVLDNSKGRGKQAIDLTSDDSETEDEDDFKSKPKPKPKPKDQPKSSNSMDEVVGFTYMGSHNFTQAAWGNMSGTVARPKLTQSNWELGVVFPLKRRDLDPTNTESLARAATNYRRDYQPYANGDHAWIQPK